MKKMIKLGQEIEERVKNLGNDGKELFDIINKKIDNLDTLSEIPEAKAEAKLYSKGEIKELVKTTELLNKASQEISNTIIMHYMRMIRTRNIVELNEAIDIELFALSSMKDFSSKELEFVCSSAKEELGEKFDEIILMTLDYFIKGIEDAKSLLKEKII